MRLPFKPAAQRVSAQARRALARARAAAGGSELPAGRGPTVADGEPRPGARERAALRRRARRTRRMREALLRELGLLVLELERRGRTNPQLVSNKARQLREVDEELRGIARALNAEETLDRVVLPGIGGPCPDCGTLLGSEDRFCPSCGRPRSGTRPAAEREPAAAQLELTGTSAESK